MESNNPYVTTAGSAASDMAAQAMGMFGADQDLVKAAFPMIMQLIGMFTGNRNLQAWGNGLISTNMTAAGLYQASVGSHLSRLQSSVSDTYSKQAMWRTFEMVERNLNSQEEYIKRHSDLQGLDAAQQAAAYDSFINSQVQGWMDKPMVGFLFDAFNSRLDIGEAHTTAVNLGKLASSAAMWDIRKGRVRQGLGGGRRLADELLTGKLLADGTFERNVPYNAADWGGIGSGGVAGLAAALAEQVDVLGGIDTGNTSQLSSAVLGLRARVKELASALSPLKDVFGDDTKKMLDAIQGITGQNLAQLSSERIQGLATGIADRVMTGQMSISDIASYTGRMETRMSRMDNIGTYNLLTAGMQGMEAAGIVKSGVAPSYRRSADYQAKVERLVSETYNSGAADLFAKTFSIWQSKAAPGEVRDAAGFQQAVQEARGRYGIGMREAAMNVAGVTFDAQLAGGYAHEGYASFVTSGEAGRMALMGFLDANVRSGVDKAVADYTFYNGIAGGNANHARRIYETTAALVTGNANVVNMTEAELSAWMAGQTYGAGTRLAYDAAGNMKSVDAMTGDEMLGALARLNGIDMSKWTLEDRTQYLADHYRNGILNRFSDYEGGSIRTALTYMKANPEFAKNLDLLVAGAGKLADMDNERAAARRRSEMERLNREVLGNGKLISLFDTKKGFSMEGLVNRLSLASAADLFSTDRSIMYTAMAAAAQFADDTYRTDSRRSPYDKEKASAMTLSIMDYVRSTEGMSNTGLTKVLAELQALYAGGAADDETKSRIGSLSSRMVLYAYLGEDLADKYYATGPDSASVQDVLDTVRNRPANAASMARLKMLDHALKTGNYTDSFKALAYRYVKNADKYGNADGLLQVGEGFTDFAAADRKENSQQPDKDYRMLNELLNSLTGGGGSRDILTSIYTLLYTVFKNYQPDLVTGMAEPGSIQSSGSTTSGGK